MLSKYDYNLGEEIERLNLSGDYNLREVEVDDYELLIWG